MTPNEEYQHLVEEVGRQLALLRWAMRLIGGIATDPDTRLSTAMWEALAEFQEETTK